MKRFACALLLLAASCGRKGDPVAPLTAASENIRDLAARLRCQSVEMTFTMPQRRTDGTELEPPVTVEVYRRQYKPPPTPVATPATTPVASPTPEKTPGKGGKPAGAGTPGQAPALPAVAPPIPQGPFEKLDTVLYSGPPNATPAPESARPAAPAGPAALDGTPAPTSGSPARARRTPGAGRGTPAAAKGTSVAATPTPGLPPPVRLSYVDKGDKKPFEPGYLYLYQIVVVDQDGEVSAPSNTVQVDYAVVPGAPTDVAARVGKGGVQLVWQRPAGDCTGAATAPPAGYNVYRRTSETGFPPVPLNPALILESRYLDATVDFDKAYSYVIRAVAAEAKREGERSKELVVEVPDVYPPEPALGLVVTRTKEGISVLWNPSPSTDVVGYHVYRHDGAEWRRLTTEPIAKTSYVDTQTPKKGARYRVTAVDRSMKKNESVPSEEVQFDEP